MEAPFSLFRALCLCFLLFCSSCGETEHTFCSLPANFAVTTVYAVPPLYTSLNSMGEFCTIRAANNGYLFSHPSIESYTLPKTALSNYSGFYLGLSGFIVGLPNIPELGYDQSRVVCFDLACSNCYNDFNITKRMELQESGKAFCPSCKRTYNLNARGEVCNGEAGHLLFRYRVSYVGDTMLISNR